MCDVESYVYLPLLEETGYMPKRKYASGEEIRNYADILAQKFKIHDRGSSNFASAFPLENQASARAPKDSSSRAN